MQTKEHDKCQPFLCKVYLMHNYVWKRNAQHELTLNQQENQKVICSNFFLSQMCEMFVFHFTLVSSFKLTVATWFSWESQNWNILDYSFVIQRTIAVYSYL